MAAKAAKKSQREARERESRALGMAAAKASAARVFEGGGWTPTRPDMEAMRGEGGSAFGKIEAGAWSVVRVRGKRKHES